MLVTSLQSSGSLQSSQAERPDVVGWDDARAATQSADRAQEGWIRDLTEEEADRRGFGPDSLVAQGYAPSTSADGQYYYCRRPGGGVQEINTDAFARDPNGRINTQMFDSPANITKRMRAREAAEQAQNSQTQASNSQAAAGKAPSA
jgi:hypothetical protein